MNKISISFSALALAMMQPLTAAPLIEPYVGVGLSFNDNTLYAATNQKEDFGADLQAGFVFSNDTEVLTAKIEPAVRIHESFSDSVFNEVAPSLTITSRSEGERTTLDFLLKVQRDSTRTSESVTTGDSTASGIVVQGKNRLFIVAGPRWLYRLTPRSSVSLNFSFSEADYNNAEDVGLFDYDNQVLGATYIQSLSERTDVWAGPSYRRYTSFDRDSAATTSGFNAGLDSAISPRLKASAEVGWVSSDIRVAKDKSTSDTVRAKSSIAYKWERGSSGVFYQYDISPTGNGELYKTNRVGANFSMVFTSLWELKLAVGYFDTEIARVSDDSLKRKSFYLAPSTQIKFANHSYIEFSIRYDSEDTEGATRDRIESGIYYIYRPTGRYF